MDKVIDGADKVIDLDKRRLRPARIEYDWLGQPTPEEWAEVKADYIAARGRTYDGMTLELLKRKQEQRLVGIYLVNAVFSDGSKERWGSFALELLEGDNEGMAPRVTFVYLRMKPGTITQGMVDTIMRIAGMIGQKVGASHILVQGRRGWEGYLERWAPREISRTWLISCLKEPEDVA